MRISISQSRVVSAFLGALLMRKIDHVESHQSVDVDEYITDDLPPAGMKVEVIGYVGKARHVIPFICCWSEEGWLVAGTRRKLAFNVAGWRRAGV